jgi:predicted branched-subunit amino acid permease
MLSLSNHRRDFLGGARAMAPWLLGIAPFGLVIGVSAARADLPPMAGWLTAPTIFAGSAQVVTIGMLNAGAAPVAIVLTVLVVNIRLVFYSAAMATYWRGTPLWWRLLGAYLLIDPTFVVGSEGYARKTDRRSGHAHYLGAAVVLWIAWLSALGLGVAAGSHVPEWLHLEFLVPLFLVSELLPKMRQAVTRKVALISGATALACLTAPMHLGIAIAIVVGVVAGSLRSPRSRETVVAAVKR